MIKNLAIRESIAGDRFVCNAMEQFGLSHEQAEHVLRVYVSMNLVTIDRVNGVYRLKDGRFWHSVPIHNALTTTPN